MTILLNKPPKTRRPTSREGRRGKTSHGRSEFPNLCSVDGDRFIVKTGERVDSRGKAGHSAVT